MKDEPIGGLLDGNKVIVLWPLLHGLLGRAEILGEGCNVPGILRLDELAGDLIQLDDAVGTGIDQLLLLLEGEGGALLLVDGNDGPEAVRGDGDGAPLGMLLGDAHPGDGLELELLARSHLDDRYALVVRLVGLLLAEKVGRHDERVVREEVAARHRDGHVPLPLGALGVLLVVVHLDLELDGAARTALVADALLVGEEGPVAVSTLEGVLRLVPDGDQAEPVGDVLVVQDGGVVMEFHQIDGQGGHLANHNAPEGVGHARVRVGQDEAHLVRGKIEDLHLGKPLVGHFSVCVYWRMKSNEEQRHREAGAQAAAADGRQPRRIEWHGKKKSKKSERNIDRIGGPADHPTPGEKGGTSHSPNTTKKIGRRYRNFSSVRTTHPTYDARPPNRIIMLRIAQTQSASLLARRSVANATATAKRRALSTKSPGPLDGDAGAAATHAHHAMTTFLVVATPAVFMVPDSWTDGFVDKAFGILVAANVSAHSWVGLNYVVTDYVPKVSKSLLGPARIATAGIGAITLLGLGKIAVSSEGGIKGAIKGLWSPKKKTTAEE